MQAARLLERAGFEQEAASCESEAFACIQDAVNEGTAFDASQALLNGSSTRFMYRRRRVSIWAVDGRIRHLSVLTGVARFSIARLRSKGLFRSRLKSGVLKNQSYGALPTGIAQSPNIEPREELLEPCGPGSAFSIPRAALQLHGLP